MQKKSLIISAIALCLSVMAVSANNLNTDFIPNENVTTVFKSNSFCVAIVKGDLETVKKLIEYGEDVNQVSQGLTPLMYAAKYNRVDIVKFLVSKGAKVNARCDKGHTALNYAQTTNAKDAIKYLEEIS